MARKPALGEIAQADHGIRMAKAYTSMLMENPDSVLQQRGRDMKIYDEILRDDQVKENACGPPMATGSLWIPSRSGKDPVSSSTSTATSS